MAKQSGVRRLTQSKAAKMLKDKTVKGKAITTKQRKFFGAIASGKKPRRK
jgi:hypothetical protein